ncbi:MAG: site-2 protease family protein [Bacteroidetes bacterium]|nr:site-2 protease family protein [Bacteroidota bacterium]
MTSKTKANILHATLFLITLVSTTLAGAEWTNGKSILAYIINGTEYTWADFAGGLPYSLSFLLILTCHEFGHYFTAVYYRVKTTLPFYIPLPPLPLSLGTLGALIRIKQRIFSNKQQFDIGLAGPLAGFVVALAVLIYGFKTLPPPEDIYRFHPSYQQYGLDYAKTVYTPEVLQREGALDLVIGKNLMFTILEKIFADPTRMPNPHEIMHYPFLFAGFLALVFTGLNLLPVGQLDGGHVLYGLVGYRWHKRIASVIYVGLIFYTGIGVVAPGQPIESIFIIAAAYLLGLYTVMRNFFSTKRDRLMYALIIFTAQYMISWSFPAFSGYNGWVLFLLLVGAFAGVYHPPSEVEQPLDLKRKILGWLALLIFVLCITPNPIA